MKFYDIDLQYLLKITMLGKTVLTSTEYHLTRYIHGVIIYMVTDGSITLKQNDEIVKLNSGDIYVFEEGEYQVPLECDNCTYYYIHFEQEHVDFLDITDDEFKARVSAQIGDFANAYIYSADPYKSIHAIIPKSLHVSDLAALDRLLAPLKEHRLTYDYNTPSYRLELSAIVSRFLMDLEDTAYRIKDSAYRKSVGTVYDTAREILKYIEKNYAENFNSEDISREFHINYNYANRIFKKFFGQSIISHRTQLRIHAAKALLLKTSVEDTAAAVGFADPYYFSRCFKKYEGHSPLEYTDMMRRIKNEDKESF